LKSQEEEEKMQESKRLSFGNMECEDPYIIQMIRKDEKDKKIKQKMKKLKLNKKNTMFENNRSSSFDKNLDQNDFTKSTKRTSVGFFGDFNITSIFKSKNS
jgi:hypothetical protein